MKRFAGIVLFGLVFAVAARPTLGQQVTTEMIGSFSASLTVNNFPNGPCFGQSDNVTFTGSIHLVATVDAVANTVDYHINLLGVKGSGPVVAKYIANGATDLLDQGVPGNRHKRPDFDQRESVSEWPVQRGISAWRSLARRTVSFGADFALNTVSAHVGDLRLRAARRDMEPDMKGFEKVALNLVDPRRSAMSLQNQFARAPALHENFFPAKQYGCYAPRLGSIPGRFPKIRQAPPPDIGVSVFLRHMPESRKQKIDPKTEGRKVR